MAKKNKEIEEFWKPLIYTKGKLSERKVMNELYDYYFILQEVPKVYCDITGGLLSKPNYSAETILGEFNERFLDKETTNEDVAEMIKTAKTLKELKEDLEDYFK
jgi:hypothetical protein